MSEILLSDIDCPYTVSVVLKTAGAGIVSVVRFLSISTLRTGLRGIRLVDDLHLDTECFCLVGNQIRYFTESPLMELLVDAFAIVNVFSDTREVSNNDGTDTFGLAILQKLCGLLVESVFDLIINLTDTFPFPTREFPPAF